jgi:hypothetical protein
MSYLITVQFNPLMTTVYYVGTKDIGMAETTFDRSKATRFHGEVGRKEVEHIVEGIVTRYQNSDVNIVAE